jgi:hypothetical protein
MAHRDGQPIAVVHSRWRAALGAGQDSERAGVVRPVAARHSGQRIHYPMA